MLTSFVETSEESRLILTSSRFTFSFTIDYNREIKYEIDVAPLCTKTYPMTADYVKRRNKTNALDAKGGM